MRNQGPIHVLMRYSDQFMSVEDTIGEHSSIIDKHGAVWIGKIGKTLAQRHIDRVNRQCGEGISTYLVLVQNMGTGGKVEYDAYKGAVLLMAKRLPSADQHLVPAYYDEQEITRQATLWTKVSKITHMRKGELSDYKIASSGMSLPTTLRKSMAALFVIEKGKGLIAVD